MARNLFEYNPVLGYRYIPGLHARVRHEDGGYLVTCNNSGFRCDHELTPAPPKGQFRILLFGDSYTAGEGVSNRFRFGDLLERGLPGVEILNFGLPSSGTDQQYLAFREFARDIRYDLVVICPMVENIRRNLQAHRWVQSAFDGGLVLRAKPYFELRGETLELRHQPVPKAIPPQPAPPPTGEGGARGLRGRLQALGAALDRRLPGFLALTRRLRRVHWPTEYSDALHPGWRLMRAILVTWIRQCRAPVIVTPLPTFGHMSKELRADCYLRRFAELGRDAGVRIVDVLPEIWKRPSRERSLIRFPTDDHPSKVGHRILADALLPVLAEHVGAAGRAG